MKNKSRQIIRKVIMIIIGATITAYGLEAVLIPNNIIDGGITGVSIMGAKIYDLPLGVFLFMLNIPFVHIGYKQIGSTFAMMSVIGITALSIGTIFMHNIEPILSGKSPLLTVVSGGILLGGGISVVLRNGGALDGSEVLAVLISRKTRFSVGDIILVINVFIFAAATFIYTLESALYSALTYYIAKTVIDIVQVSFEKSKSVHVISEKTVKMVLERFGHSITYTTDFGSFSSGEIAILNHVIYYMKETKILEIIKEIDPNTFIIILRFVAVASKNVLFFHF